MTTARKVTAFSPGKDNMEGKLQVVKTVTVLPLQQAYQTIIGYLPQVLGALAILLVGWLVAIVIRKVAGKALRAAGLDVISERTGVTGILQRGGIRKRPSELLGWGVYWLILFSALVTTFNALGLEIASALLRVIVLYIPSILVALLLLGLGFFASRYVDALATGAAAALDIPFPDVLGRAAQTLIVFIAATMALNELGIATEVVSLGFVVLLGVLGMAAVIAFGLGSKEIAGQLAAGQCLRQTFKPGDAVQYERYEGTIEAITYSHVSLNTPQGIVIIPNTVFLHTTVIRHPPNAETAGRQTDSGQHAT
jgi:small-conductance mechanosensitive channel